MIRHLGISGSPQWMTGVCFMVLPASFFLRDGWGATITTIPGHHGFCRTPQLNLRSLPVVKTSWDPFEKQQSKVPLQFFCLHLEMVAYVVSPFFPKLRQIHMSQMPLQAWDLVPTIKCTAQDSHANVACESVAGRRVKL